MQTAQDLPLYQVILYGYALCGSFFSTQATKYGTAERLALTSVAKLQQFLDACGSLRGTERARQALRYVRERSASPAESKNSLVLTLPLRHGGYALPFALLNAEILLPAHLQKLTGRKTLRADLLWEKQKVIVEYDSNTSHLESMELCSDATKRIALQELGYTVISITHHQLYQQALMDATAQSLRKALGLRKPQRVPPNYESRKAKLRAELGL